MRHESDRTEPEFYGGDRPSLPVVCLGVKPTTRIDRDQTCCVTYTGVPSFTMSEARLSIFEFHAARYGFDQITSKAQSIAAFNTRTLAFGAMRHRGDAVARLDHEVSMDERRGSSHMGSD